MGIRMLLLSTSNISRMDRPLMAIPLQTPKPREEGTPRIRHSTNTNRQVFFRPQPNLSTKIDTMVSIKEMEEVRAANSTSTKNTAPIISPPTMLSKTLGRVTNIRPGPLPRAASSPPENTKTAGMIIRPARNAIPVSKISIWWTEDSSRTSFFM